MLQLVPSARRTFPLRFRDETLMDALRLVANARGISVNALIESIVMRELPKEAALVESDLAGRIEALQAYKGRFEDDWAEFARAEGSTADPLQAKMITAD